MQHESCSPTLEIKLFEIEHILLDSRRTKCVLQPLYNRHFFFWGFKLDLHMRIKVFEIEPITLDEKWRLQ